MRRFPVRSLVGFTWALLAWGILAYYTTEAIREAWTHELMSGFPLFFCQIMIPPAGAIWLHLRVFGPVARLCERPRREEIALTRLGASEYLGPRLWPFAARALAPFAASVLAMNVFEAFSDGGAVRSVVYLAAAATGWLLASIGVFDLVYRRCAPSPSGGVFIPRMIGWCAVSIAVPGFAFAFFVAAENRLDQAALALLYALGFALILKFGAATRSCAYEAYHRFD